MKMKKENLKNVKFKGKVEKKYIPYILSKSNLNILNYKQADTWKYGGSQNKQFEYLASGDAEETGKQDLEVRGTGCKAGRR